MAKLCNMKKIFLSLLFISASIVNLFAQFSGGGGYSMEKSNTPALIQGNFGLLFADVSFSDDVNSQDYFSNVTGIGLTISGSKNIMPFLFGNLYLGAGLDYYSWNAVDNQSDETVATYDAIYLDLSATIQRNINEKFKVGTGFSFDFGVLGNQTITNSGNDYALFRDEALKRTNMNLILNTDYNMNGQYSLFAEYRLGLLNIEGKWNANDQRTSLGSFRVGMSKMF